MVPLTLLFLNGCEPPIRQLMRVVPLIRVAWLLFISCSLTMIQLVLIGSMIIHVGGHGAFLVLIGVIIREHVEFLLGRLEDVIIGGSVILLINPLTNGKLESLIKHRVQPVRVRHQISSAIVNEMLREQDLSWLQLREPCGFLLFLICVPLLWKQ